MSQIKLDEIYKILDSNVDYADKVAKQTVNSQTEPLDNLMSDIYENIISVEDPATEQIEKYFLALSNCLYFLGDKLEKIGLYDDLSKSQAKEKYNKAYMESLITTDPKKKVTVAEAQTSAENSSTYETMVNVIYARSYKIFKYKIEAAQTMLSSLSKMLSKRMQDAQMSMTTKESSKQYLVEGNYA